MSFSPINLTCPRSYDARNYAGETNLEVGIIYGAGQGWFPNIFGKMLATATGIGEFANMEYLWKVGERIVNLEWAFNMRERFNRKRQYY